LFEWCEHSRRWGEGKEDDDGEEEIEVLDEKRLV